MGKKEVRAEPWSSMLAARNVWLVEDGSWEILDFIQEHLAFPLGQLKDIVDAASGGFNYLANAPTSPVLRTVQFSTKKKQPFTIVVCTKDELANLVVEEPSLLVTIRDPLPEFVAVGGGGDLTLRELPPRNGLVKILGWLPLDFTDLKPEDFQDRWEDPVPPWDRPVRDLVMQQAHGKRLWGFLTRKTWQPTPQVFVLQDDGDGRALSIALAISAAQNLPASAIIKKAADEDWQAKDKGEEPPNPHVFSMTKSTRHMVVT
jgi:hypothetical protein